MIPSDYYWIKSIKYDIEKLKKYVKSLPNNEDNKTIIIKVNDILDNLKDIK